MLIMGLKNDNITSVVLVGSGVEVGGEKWGLED